MSQVRIANEGNMQSCVIFTYLPPQPPHFEKHLAVNYKPVHLPALHFRDDLCFNYLRTCIHPLVLDVRGKHGALLYTSAPSFRSHGDRMNE